MDYKKDWRQRTRAWAVALLGGKCSHPGCGAVEALEFDHRNAAEKLFEISVGIRYGYGRTRLEPELAKCQLLCKFHHIAKTQSSPESRSVPHGGGKQGKRGCFCEPCKSQKARYMQKYAILKRERRRSGRSVSG